jgi:hypothetical protein
MYGCPKVISRSATLVEGIGHFVHLTILPSSKAVPSIAEALGVALLTIKGSSCDLLLEQGNEVKGNLSQSGNML